MNVVSLFAGCGGLDLGFKMAGFNVIWANEYDPSIHDTYKHNHPNTEFCGIDIRLLKSDDIPDSDGIIGGPPCQSWSIGGRGLGIEDDRGKLFFDYIRIVENKRPKFFLIENVAGILNEKHAPAFTLFIERLEIAGYNVSYKLLNTADYVIPQDRFRVFIVGLRKDLNLEYEFPSPLINNKVSLRRAIGDIIDLPQFSSGNIKPLVTEHGFWNHDVYDGPYSPNYMHSNRVRNWDELSFTIQAQASNAPQHPQAPKMVRTNNGGRIFVKGSEHLYRRLSVRECARIQTFPDSFHFIYSNVKDGYKMVGNAVPPRMAFHLANQFNKILEPAIPIHQSEPEKHKLGSPKVNINTNQEVLIGLVKKDVEDHFLSHDVKYYYTGRKTPSTLHFNKMKYFIPYFKNKGIRDIYRIKTTREGSKKDIYPNNTDTDIRIIFEIEYIKQLFDTFLPVTLDIWYTFSLTSVEQLEILKEEMMND